MILRPLKCFTNVIRNVSVKPSTNGDINPFIYNRNPRNLEKMRLDRKPTGYSLEKVFVEYWHKLEIKTYSKFVIAELVHNTNKVVVTASTNEWAIYKHLYSKKDKAAHIVLAQVFAERCLESGMYSFAYDRTCNEGNLNIESFLKVLEYEGLILEEPPQFDITDIWYKKREKRPWTVLED